MVSDILAYARIYLIIYNVSVPCCVLYVRMNRMVHYTYICMYIGKYNVCDTCVLCTRVFNKTKKYL